MSQACTSAAASKAFGLQLRCRKYLSQKPSDFELLFPLDVKKPSFCISKKENLREEGNNSEDKKSSCGTKKKKKKKS